MTQRSSWLTAPIVFGLFVGGGYVGMQVSRAVAPDSDIAEFFGFLTLPAAFIVGTAAWAGLAVPSALRRLVRMVRDRNGSSFVTERTPSATVPPGSFVFVPVALVTSTVSGVIAAVASDALTAGWAGSVYLALGLGYGTACWRLARAGYLPFPRE